MKWTTATGLLVVTGVAAIGGKAVFESEELPPEDVLALVDAQMEVPGYDERQALRELGRAFLDERVAADPALATRLLSKQAEIFRGMGAWSDARAVLERIVQQYRPDDRALQLEIAELQSMQGQTQAARLRVRSILDVAPDFGPAWRLRGLLETQHGAEILEEARTVARLDLVAEDAERAVALLDELGTRESGDPARVQLAHELRELFGTRHQDALARVLALTDRASEVHTEARLSYGHAFEHSVDPVGAREYAELLVAAGRADLAVDFGLAALALEAVHDDADFRVTLIRALQRLGHERRAAALAAEWPYRQLGASVELADLGMRVMCRVRDWRHMGPAAHLLRTIGTSVDETTAWFFLAKMTLAQADQKGKLTAKQVRGKFAKTAEWLELFLRSESVEPYPGALAEAHFSLARAYQALGDTERETQILTKAVLDFPWSDGQGYLRIVELASGMPGSGYRIPEERWTIAMCLLPHRSRELFPRWVELGEASLASDGQDFDKLYERMMAQGRVLPAADVGPYTRYRVARRHFERGGHLAAIRVCRELLQIFPGHIPLLDTLIQSLFARGTERQAIERIIERLELVGADSVTRGYLERLSPEAFTTDQVLRAMRADPHGLGRTMVGRHLLENGSPERAWRALEQRGRADNDELRRLRGEGLIALGRFEEAATELGALDDEDTDPLLYLTRIRARLGARDEAGARALVERFARLKTLDRSVALDVVDELLANESMETARVLLVRLDSDGELRGGEVLRRMALRAAAAGDREAADEALERAESFFADGEVEQARLLFAIDDHGWVRLPRLVRELRATEFEPSPLEDAILALLEERLEAGEQMAESGVRQDPSSAEWTLVRAAARALVDGDPRPPRFCGPEAAEELPGLLRGSGETPRDPRHVLGLLLALDRPGWAVWALPRTLRLFREGGGVVWPAYLSTLGYRALGQRNIARQALERLTELAPTFGPGWDALLAVYDEEFPDNPYHGRILATRAKRLRAVGRTIDEDPLQVAIDAASELVLDGRFAEAAERVQAALEASEATTNRGRALLARMYAQTGRYGRAVVEYDRACEELEPAPDHALVAEFIDVLARARKKGSGAEAVSGERAIAFLDRLEARFPYDPLIPLERTRTEVANDPENPDLFVGRARRNLQALRERTEGVALNSLRRDSAGVWVRYLLGLAPSLAQELIETDLAQHPGDLDLWLALARTYEIRGLGGDARELYSAIVGMSDDADAHLAYARLLEQGGAPLKAIEQHLEVVRAASGGRRSVLPHYVQTRAMLHDPDPDLRAVLSTLQRLWAERDEVAGELDSFELGRTYITALASRRLEEDLQVLPRVAGQLEPYAQAEAYGAEFLRALKGVVREIRPEPARKRPRVEESPTDDSGDEDSGDEDSDGDVEDPPTRDRAADDRER